MDFNICLANLHPNDRGSETLGVLLNYTMRSISINGHNITLSSETFDNSAINLIFESFNPETASLILKLKKRNNLKIGVIATELMTLEGFPYGSDGIYVGDGFAKIDYLTDRFNGFSAMLDGVDFLWCFLERTARIFQARINSSYHYPFGFVEPYLPIKYRRCKKDIDVLFFGTATRHRIEVIENLTKSSINVVTTGRGWPTSYMPGIGLTSLLDRSKIGLNLTLTRPRSSDYDPRFVSCARITEMFNHDLLVVSEEIPYDNPYKEYMICTSLDTLADCIKGLLKDYDSNLGTILGAEFRLNYRAEDICKSAINSTLDLYSKYY